MQADATGGEKKAVQIANAFQLIAFVNLNGQRPLPPGFIRHRFAGVGPKGRRSQRRSQAVKQRLAAWQNVDGWHTVD